MNRRDFLSGRVLRATRSVSCKKIFMRYVDAQGNGDEETFLRGVREEFRPNQRIRLCHTSWLDYEGLRDKLKPLLEEYVSQGGIVEYL